MVLKKPRPIEAPAIPRAIGESTRVVPLGVGNAAACSKVIPLPGQIQKDPDCREYQSGTIGFREAEAQVDWASANWLNESSKDRYSGSAPYGEIPPRLDSVEDKPASIPQIKVNGLPAAAHGNIKACSAQDCVENV
jgi:hypothetical protein